MFSGIVAEVLRDDNYENWSKCVTSYLEARGLWDVVIATTGPPNREDGEKEFENWRRKNAAALHAIQISCSPSMLSQLEPRTSAKAAWNQLATLHGAEETEDDEDDTCAEFQLLVRAIHKKDLDGVKDFIKRNPDAKCAQINCYGNTAIHIAIDAGQDEIAKELVEVMSQQELEQKNNRDYTALHLAAAWGNVKVAKSIIDKNDRMLSIGNQNGSIPINSACAEGHKEMTRYLYSVTPIELLNERRGASLIVSAIRINLFDVALDVLSKYPHLATVRSVAGYIPLTTLASTPLLFPSSNSNRLIFWKRIIYHCIRVKLPSSSNDFCIHIPQEEERDKEKSLFQLVIGQIRRMSSILLKFLGVKELYDMKLNQLYAIEILKFMSKNLPTSNNSRVSKAFFEAVKCGIVEFVVELCRANPQLLDDVDENARTFFFLATRLRHENIFNLIYGLNNRKNSITGGVDKFENSLLHLAGMLAPPSQIAHISGAALKMQRELQWYKEVESLVDPSSQFYRNKDRELPYQVFTKEHKALMEQGEAWMKENASSCSIVAGLIVTVMFAAAFTVPGGSDQNTGYPIFLHKTSFKVFAIADGVSLFASTSSVIMFLGILTSRYREEDFLKSLPTKLIIGFSTLFISIAAMMVAFCAAIIIMFKGQLNIIIPIVVLASFPIGFFVWLQFPLLIEIFMSTYGPGIFKRKMKPWL